MTIKRVIFLSDNLYKPVTANDQDPTFLKYTKFIDDKIFKNFKSMHLDLYAEYQRKFDAYLLSISSRYDLARIIAIGSEINDIISSNVNGPNSCNTENFQDIYNANGELFSSLTSVELSQLNASLDGFSLTELLLQSLNSVFFAVGELTRLLDQDKFELVDADGFFNITNAKLHDFKSKCLTEFMVQLDYNSNQYDTGSVDNQTEYLMRSGFVEFLYTRIINDLFNILFELSDDGVIYNKYIKSAFFAAILVLRSRYNLYAEYMSLINHLVGVSGMGNFANLGSYSISSAYYNFNKVLSLTTSSNNSFDSNSHYYNTRLLKEDSWDYKYDQYYNFKSNYDTLIIHNGYLTHSMLKYANMNSAVDYYIIKLENIRDFRYNNDVIESEYNPGDLLLNEFSRYHSLPNNMHIDPSNLSEDPNILSFTDRYLAYYPFDVTIPYQVLDNEYRTVLNNYTFDSMYESSTNFSDTINTYTVGTKSIYSGCYIVGNNTLDLVAHKYRYNSALFDNFDAFSAMSIPISKSNTIKDVRFILEGISSADIITQCETSEFINNYIYVDPEFIGINAFVPSTYLDLKTSIMLSGNNFGIILDADVYSAEYLKPNPIFRVDLKSSVDVHRNTNYIVKFNLSHPDDYSKIYRNILIWSSMILSTNLSFVITTSNNAMFYNIRLFVRNLAMRISEDINIYMQIPESIQLNNIHDIASVYDGYDVISHHSTIRLNSCITEIPAADLISVISLDHSIPKATITGFIFGRVSLFGSDFEGDVNNTTVEPELEIEGIFPQFPYSKYVGDSIEYADSNKHLIKTYYPGVTPSITTQLYYTVLAINIRLIDFEKEPSGAQVFETWGRFSHNGDSQPYSVTEMNSWVYDSEEKVIIGTTNSTSFCGFYSLEKLENYDITAQLTSNSSDNDRLIFIIAFVIVDDWEYTLTAVRDNETSVTWGIYYNYKQSDEWLIVDGSANIPSVSGWSYFPDGTTFHIVRTGDVINSTTTQAGSLTLVPESLLSINLNDDPRLAKFKGPQSYGYGSQSQNATVIHNMNLGSDYTSEEEWYVNIIAANNYQIVSDGGQILQPLSYNTTNSYSYDGLRIGGSANKITHFPGDEILPEWYYIGGDEYLTAATDIAKYRDPSTNSYLDELYPDYLLAAKSKLYKSLTNMRQNYVVTDHLWGDAIWPYYTQYVKDTQE